MKKLLIAGVINLLLLNIVLAEDKWEYIVYQTDRAINRMNLWIDLNDFGKEGWELITVNEHLGSWKTEALFIFKRKIEAEDEDD